MNGARIDLDAWFTEAEFEVLVREAYKVALSSVRREVVEEAPRMLREAAAEGDFAPPPYICAEAFAGRVLDRVAEGLCELGARRNRTLGLAVESGGAVVSYHSSGCVGCKLVEEIDFLLAFPHRAP